MSTLSLADGLEQFLRSKSISVREKTLQFYTGMTSDLQDAVRICELADAPLDCLSLSDLERIILTFDNHPAFHKKGDSTKKKLVAHLKSAFRWFYQNKYISVNLMQGFRYRRVHVAETQPFTGDEIILILSRKPKTSGDYRDIALWYLMTDTGIRCDEVCNVKITDFNSSRLQIWSGKGGKNRVVSCGSQTATVVADYINNHRPSCECPYLFVTKTGTQLKSRNLAKRLTLWAEKTGVKHAHLHRFRATFATRFVLQNGGDLVTLQALLGHSTIDMSRHYVKLARAEEARMLNSTSSVVDALVEKDETRKPTSIVTTVPAIPVDVLPSTPIQSPDAAVMQQFAAMMGGVMGAAMAMFQAMSQGKASPEALTSFLSAGEGK